MNNILEFPNSHMKIVRTYPLWVVKVALMIIKYGEEPYRTIKAETGTCDVHQYGLVLSFVEQQRQAIDKLIKSGIEPYELGDNP